jgi:hypothetical protein
MVITDKVWLMSRVPKGCALMQEDIRDTVQCHCHGKASMHCVVASTMTSSPSIARSGDAIGDVDQWQPDNRGLRSGPHGPRSKLMSFFLKLIFRVD